MCEICDESPCICYELEEAITDEDYPLTQEEQAQNELIHLQKVCRELHLSL
jgi:hypothetical protein